MNGLFRRKPLGLVIEDAEPDERRLRKTLGPWSLMAIGIGCTIGVGIFVLPGIEASKHAGPAIMLSFIIAAVAAACSALSYAEMASMIPTSGSAYSYSYASLGELTAWLIGWDLVLEYMVGASLVAIGWSGYFTNLFNRLAEPLGLSLPHAITSPPFGADPGIINLPAVVIVILITALLSIGIRESARVNTSIVVLKVSIILIFILSAIWSIDTANWRPFMPFGFSGVAQSAAIVFVAYIGFDVTSTAAEEAIDPQRDVPIGILGSLLVTTLLYVLTSGIITGVASYTQLNVPDPLALILNLLQMPMISTLVSLGAIAGITSVLLVLLMGQPRILFAMSRDGLLPARLCRVHPRFRTPFFTTLLTGGIVATASAFFSLDVVAEMVSIGTLFAFVLVCSGVIALRYTHPEFKRDFRVPLFPAVPLLGVVLCGYLMFNLSFMTWMRFLVWMAIGMAVYFSYGYRKSRLSV